VPISGLFAVTLWLGNAAYLYLSVSFIQMLKALMPITVFSVGVLLGTEVFSWPCAANMGGIGVGVAIASYGELALNVTGLVLQLGSIVSESFRLALVQILLQRRGIKLNPVTTLYYVAPACFAFLVVPFTFFELPKMTADSELKARRPRRRRAAGRQRSTSTAAAVALKATPLQPLPPPPHRSQPLPSSSSCRACPHTYTRPARAQISLPWLTLSCAAAFALNMSVFLLIGRSSALTMNVAGVVKDWLLIGLSVLIFRSSITGLQLGGYGLAFAGVAWYNRSKMQQVVAAASAQAAAAAAPPAYQPVPTTETAAAAAAAPPPPVIAGGAPPNAKAQ
jgi:hypothetical protein